MGIVTERDKSRIAALFLLIRPAQSIAAKVQRLEPSEREIYERYSIRYSQWISECKRACDDDDQREGRPYELSLQGRGPHLPNDIAIALNGTVPTIIATMTDDKAAQTYMDYADANR
jgi:hypothetical protein